MNILAIFADAGPDVIACGATLARSVSLGDKVSTFIFADRGSRRHEEFLATCAVLGLNGVVKNLGYPGQDVGLNHPISQIAQDVTDAIEMVEPSVIYTHWPLDLNPSYRAIAEAVLIATRPFESTVARIVSCEIPASTAQAFGSLGFRPNVYVDITEALDLKCAALRCYADEILIPPQRAETIVRAIATVRGSEAGCEYAESFVLLREVVR